MKSAIKKKKEDKVKTGIKKPRKTEVKVSVVKAVKKHLEKSAVKKDMKKPHAVISVSKVAIKDKKPVRQKVTATKEQGGISVSAAPLEHAPSQIASVKEESVKDGVLKEEIKQRAVKEAELPKKEQIEEVKAKPAVALVSGTGAKIELKELELKLPINVKDLSVKLQEKSSILIKALMQTGIMVGINQALDESTVVKVCEKYGYRIKQAPDEEELALRMHYQVDTPDLLQFRAPVVTLMGHVDHGKTSLLDAIRKSKVAEAEHGGITQHIGAYRVVLPKGEITFLDTPGHEAFTAMRARGASVTDIVILVVAADEGIMPQTQEAINHARAAGVSIIVAINKVDKPQANIDMVKKQLSELNLTCEDWGGKTITVPVSAKSGKGIDELLEMILLEAQMLELKANYNRPARGIVIESKLSKGKGPVAHLLIQNGTLHINDNIIVGRYYGKIRAMFDDHARPIIEARPSFPVEVLGLSATPGAGERFFVIEDEKKAKELASLRQEKEREQQIKAVKRISLDDLHAQILEGKLKELNIIIKADVHGSLGAIKEVLNKLNVSEIKLNIIHEGVGSINTSDAILAVASNALILGFHVSADEMAKELAFKEGIDVRTYNIIYELGNDIKQALEGMLEPKLKKIFLGRAEVRKVFKVTRAGEVAGCFVNKGKILRASLVNLLRNGQVIFEGSISSLKRFKDDAREISEGFECGITLSNFQDLKEGDIIEAYGVEKIARKL